MANILLAGASGSLGTAVHRELLGRGFRVRRLVRCTPGPQDWLGDLRRPESLSEACAGVTAVISCAGASMCLQNWRDRTPFRDVDWMGNRNLLREAKRAGVKKFVYVSLAGGTSLTSTEYACCHEQFVGELTGSGLDWSVVRPTGFFCFFGEILRLAARGRGMVFGDGCARTNPIHQADAARACVDALRLGAVDMPVGGPVTYTRQQIVEMAFSALGRTPSVRSIPLWTAALIRPLVHFANPRIASLVEFGAAVSTVDCLAPQYGKCRLEDYFRDLARGHKGC